MSALLLEMKVKQEWREKRAGGGGCRQREKMKVMEIGGRV